MHQRKEREKKEVASMVHINKEATREGCRV
jgi:hypothetical protein